MKAIVEIVPGKDPKLCDRKCPAMIIFWGMYGCGIKGNILKTGFGGEILRCQACLDATAEYEAIIESRNQWRELCDNATGEYEALQNALETAKRNNATLGEELQRYIAGDSLAEEKQ